MFMIINVPATVFLSLVLAYALNTKIRGLWFFRGAYYAPYVTASVAIVTVWLFMFGETGLVNTVLGPLAPDPSWLINKLLGHAHDRDIRDLEAARFLHPALPRGAAERTQGGL